MFWQLTIDSCDPPALARFWAAALGWTARPPQGTQTWWRHYRDRLGDEPAFDNRLFDPNGHGPALWFQPVPESKSGKNRLHLDLYPTERDNELTWERRVEVVEATVTRLVGLGATVRGRTAEPEDAADPVYFATMRDPEGNEFCIS